MTKKELDRFRSALKTWETELSDGSRKREAVAVETTGDELDRIQHAQERDFAMAVLDRDSVRLREIRAALERIDRSSFGICFNCQESIGAKRLAAVPWTALCITCQEAKDRTANDSREQDEQLHLNTAQERAFAPSEDIPVILLEMILRPGSVEDQRTGLANFE